MMPYEKQIAAYDIPNAPDSQKDVRSILFAYKIKAYLFRIPAYPHSGS